MDDLKLVKTVTDHPTEDIFGDEILTDDVYYKFGQNIVLEHNLRTYLVYQNVKCYRAG